MTELYLVRHGETDYNKSHLYIGGRSSHLPLNDTGIEQSRRLGKYFANQNICFNYAFCSSAIRAKQTLDGILLHNNIEHIDYSSEIEELSQGKWEGCLRSEIYTPEQLAIINSQNYTFKAPDGESQEEVEHRMYNFIHKSILEPQKTGNTLLVTHGMAIKCLLRKILDSNPNMTYKINVSNASITKISFSNSNGWRIDYLNNTIE